MPPCLTAFKGRIKNEEVTRSENGFLPQVPATLSSTLLAWTGVFAGGRQAGALLRNLLLAAWGWMGRSEE